MHVANYLPLVNAGFHEFTAVAAHLRRTGLASALADAAHEMMSAEAQQAGFAEGRLSSLRSRTRRVMRPAPVA